MLRALLLDVARFGCAPPAESGRVPRRSVDRRGGHDMHVPWPTTPQSHAAQLLTPCPAADGCRPWARTIPRMCPPTDELPRSIRISNGEDARVDMALRGLLARNLLHTTVRRVITAAQWAVHRPGERPGSRCVAGERDEGATPSQKPRRSRLDSNPNIVHDCVGIHQDERCTNLGENEPVVVRLPLATSAVRYQEDAKAVAVRHRPVEVGLDGRDAPMFGTQKVRGYHSRHADRARRPLLLLLHWQLNKGATSGPR
eukprot:1727842-Prymnesium_polylepis.1